MSALIGLVSAVLCEQRSGCEEGSKIQTSLARKVVRVASLLHACMTLILSRVVKYETLVERWSENMHEYTHTDNLHCI